MLKQLHTCLSFTTRFGAGPDGRYRFRAARGKPNSAKEEVEGSSKLILKCSRVHWLSRESVLTSVQTLVNPAVFLVLTLNSHGVGSLCRRVPSAKRCSSHARERRELFRAWDTSVPYTTFAGGSFERIGESRGEAVEKINQSFRRVD